MLPDSGVTYLPGGSSPQGAGIGFCGSQCGSQRERAGTHTDPDAPRCCYSNDVTRAGDRTRTGDVQLGKLAFYQLNYARELWFQQSQRSGLNRRPLDYESSALPLSYAGTHALARTRTATPYGTTPSRWRVYQFHHQGDCSAPPARCALHAPPATRVTGLTGLEPATSGVTDRHSNQLSYSPFSHSLPLASPPS